MQYIQPPLSVAEARQRFGQMLQLSTGPAYYLVNHNPAIVSARKLGFVPQQCLPDGFILFSLDKK